MLSRAGPCCSLFSSLPTVEKVLDRLCRRSARAPMPKHSVWGTSQLNVQSSTVTVCACLTNSGGKAHKLLGLHHAPWCAEQAAVCQCNNMADGWLAWFETVGSCKTRIWKFRLTKCKIEQKGQEMPMNLVILDPLWTVREILGSGNCPVFTLFSAGPKI